MTDWVRLWHDMPTDPKWRVVARKSGTSIPEVISVFVYLMADASANANERGRTHANDDLFAEDISAALDIGEERAGAILSAMLGKVIDKNGRLLGWEKRQPKREDSSADRARAWREERKRTQTNANERPETETELSTPLGKPNGAPVDSDKQFWDTAKAYLGPGKASLIGQWVRDHGKDQTAAAVTAAQLERAVNPVEFIQGRFRKAKQEGGLRVPC